MANLDVLTYGFAFVSDQGSFGWSTVSLLTVGTRRMLIDTGPASRRANLVAALASHSIEPEEIDTVILTHLHWDHCQNTDLFDNARVVVHPREIDYAKNPNRGDRNTASYIADMLHRMRVEPAADGDVIADGVSVIDTPGHTKGHISVLLKGGGERVLVAGDALPDSGTVRRKLPYNVFWDVDDAAESVEKMLDASHVFYPGHDRPFRLDGEEINYLHGPSVVEVTDSNEGGGAAALTFRVTAKRPVNIDTVQRC